MALLWSMTCALSALGVVQTPNSGGWCVTVEGRSLPLHYVKINSEDEAAARIRGEWYQFGSFTIDQPVRVNIVCDRPLAGAEVLPRACVRQVAEDFCRESERAFSFTAKSPFRLSFLPQGRVGALHLIAAPPDPVALAAKGRKKDGVRFFGPGEHHVKMISARSNETLVIEEGAVVYGHLDVRGTNITVCGGGMISGGDWTHLKGPGPHSNAIVSSTNVTLRGITLTQPYAWTLGIRDSKEVLIDGLCITGGNRINDDGIDVINSTDVTIRRAFIRTQDDNIAAKGFLWRSGKALPPVENVLVEDCVLWTDQANSFRLGFECDAAYMKNIRVRNIDVVRYSPIPKKLGDMWRHAVFKIQASGGLVFSGLDVDTVRVESDGGDVCLVDIESCLTFTGSRGGRYDYICGGRVENCRFANISVMGKKEGFTGWIHLKGRKVGEEVSDISFERVNYFGVPVRADSASVHIVGPFVKNVSFADTK